MVNIIRKIFGGTEPEGRKPLRMSAIEDYIKKEYQGYDLKLEQEVKLPEFVRLRQAEMGDGLNCSVTSITACVNYLTRGKASPREIYEYVMKVARFFLYTPKLWGTLSFTIGPIYHFVLRHYGIKRHIGTRLFKGFGYSSGTIISRINSGIPVMINMFRDGRRYYHNHTVTVTGYRIYSDGRHRRVFLILNDNWAHEETLLDYNKLWIISSANF